MQVVGVMPLPSPSLHPRLPEALHAHGRVAMNVPVLRRLFKQRRSRWAWGDVVLSAVGASRVLGHSRSTVLHLLEEKQRELFHSRAIILIPLLAVNGIFLRDSGRDWMAFLCMATNHKP